MGQHVKSPFINFSPLAFQLLKLSVSQNYLRHIPSRWQANSDPAKEGMTGGRKIWAVAASERLGGFALNLHRSSCSFRWFCSFDVANDEKKKETSPVICGFSFESIPSGRVEFVQSHGKWDIFKRVLLGSILSPMASSRLCWIILTKYGFNKSNTLYRPFNIM